MLNFEIYAVDAKNYDHRALIASCFNLGLAKSWVENELKHFNNDLEIVSLSTGQKYYYNHKEQKWN